MVGHAHRSCFRPHRAAWRLNASPPLAMADLAQSLDSANLVLLQTVSDPDAPEYTS